MARNNRYRQERPQRRGCGCLLPLVILVWLAVAVVLGYQYFVRPQVSQLIGQQLADQVGPAASSEDAEAPGDVINDQAAQAIPTIVAAIPSGELRISQDQANEFLSSQPLGPIDSANVRFTPGEVQVDIKALGTTSTARMGLAVQDGRIITINPSIDGLLGQVLSLDELSSTIEAKLNDQLAAQGRRVREVQVNQGELLVTIENQ